MKFKDLSVAITEIIKQNGGEVMSGEVAEGFPRPAYFVDILPCSVEKSGQWYETITAYCQIRYYPKKETNEECIRIADLLCDIFSENIIVGDRNIAIEDITFDVDGYVLTMDFAVEFMRNGSKALEDAPYMENIKLREEI